MGLRRLRYEDDDILRKKAKPVKEFNKRLESLIDDMLESMEKFNGVGLAAPQIGILKRVVVIDVGNGPIELINPEVIESSGEQERAEGCLSIPGKTGIVKRPAFTKVKAFNRLGQEIEIIGEELLSVALNHEIDHLDGILYTDKVIRMCTEEDEKEKADDGN